MYVKCGLNRRGGGGGVKFDTLANLFLHRVGSFGALVVRDEAGHGSVLILLKSTNFAEIRANTVGFQNDCCGEVDMCDQFYRRRIPRACTFYRPPRFGKYYLQ